MLTAYQYGGKSDVGYHREINEDYIGAWELDDHTLLLVMADGSGSKASSLQPASICASDIYDAVKEVYDADRDLLTAHAELFLTAGMRRANRVLGAFKHGNEELYAGFSSSVTCLLLWENGQFAFAHAGNTRLYLIRIGRDGLPIIRALTRDHTVAQDLLENGIINSAQYHTHPDRLSLTSGLGVVTEPMVQHFSGAIKEQDFLLMTSDGIHYAVRPDAMADLILQTASCDEAADVLIRAAQSLKYNDNMSAMLVYRPKMEA